MVVKAALLSFPLHVLVLDKTRSRLKVGHDIRERCELAKRTTIRSLFSCPCLCGCVDVCRCVAWLHCRKERSKQLAVFFVRTAEPIAEMGEARRHGDRYIVTEEEISMYKNKGYVHLRGVMSEEEMRELEEEFMAFIRREVHVEGRDFCDMSGDYTKPIDSFSIINIMLPSKYNPRLKGNIYEKRAASITEQLLGSDMVVDYDQLLAKPPNKPDAEFKWHQDLAYWPVTKDTRTASFWLAIDNSRLENGCVQFVPGSHVEKALRHHGPLHGDRDKSHTLAATLSENDKPKAAEIERGDVTVHHERVLHGSGGNFSSSSWRRAWVVAFRSQDTVQEERQMGFTHSHNDKLQVLNEVGKEVITG